MYRELPVAAQTAYAELFEMVQAHETTRTPAALSGKVLWKTIKGRRYAYWAFKEIDGRKREYYLGPDGPAITAIEEARARGVPSLAAIARQAASALAQGCAPVPPKHFRIVKRFADYQFFRAGGLLVGTHAFAAMGNQLGVAWEGNTRTLDLDFAHRGAGGNVEVALPADLRIDAHDALASLQMGYLPALGGPKGLASQYVSEREPDLRIDFITPMRRKAELLAMPDLGIVLAPLKFLDYLFESPGQAVLIDRADACLVNLPDPARYGLHKLIVAAERGPRHAKYRKDIAQAVCLIDWHLQRAPGALIDAWQVLSARGAGWVKRARQSLGAAPAEASEIVERFKTMIKSK